MARSAQEFLQSLLNSITRYYTATYSSDTNLYQILKTYGAQFTSGSLELDTTRNNAFVVSCDSSKLFDNFGTFFPQSKYYLQSATDDKYFSGSATYIYSVPTTSFERVQSVSSSRFDGFALLGQKSMVQRTLDAGYLLGTYGGNCVSQALGKMWVNSTYYPGAGNSINIPYLVSYDPVTDTYSGSLSVLLSSPNLPQYGDIYQHAPWGIHSFNKKVSQGKYGPDQLCVWSFENTTTTTPSPVILSSFDGVHFTTYSYATPLLLTDGHDISNAAKYSTANKSVVFADKLYTLMAGIPNDPAVSGRYRTYPFCLSYDGVSVGDGGLYTNYRGSGSFFGDHVARTLFTHGNAMYCIYNCVSGSVNYAPRIYKYNAVSWKQQGHVFTVNEKVVDSISFNGHIYTTISHASDAYFRIIKDFATVHQSFSFPVYTFAIHKNRLYVGGTDGIIYQLSTDETTWTEVGNLDNPTVAAPVHTLGTYVPSLHNSVTSYSVVFGSTPSTRSAIPFKSNLNLTSGVTIEAWVKTTSVAPAGEIIISKPTDSFQSPFHAWVLYIKVGVPILQIWSGTGSVAVDVSGDAKILINDGIWHHIVATADGTTLRMYVDGVLKGSKASTALPGNTISTKPVIVGSTYTPSIQNYVGSLDALRIYDGAISSQSVAAHYNSGKGLYTPHSGSYLRGQWHFNDGIRALRATDSSGYNNHITFSGSANPTWAVGKVSLEYNDTNTSLYALCDRRLWRSDATVTQYQVSAVSGSAIRYNVTERIALPSYRKQLSFMMEAAMQGGTPAGVTRMANAFTLINPDIREFVSLPSWKLKSTEDTSNYALRFDTQTGKIRIPIRESLNLTNGVTIEAWVKHRSNGTNQLIIAKPTATGLYPYWSWVLQITASGHSQLNLWGGIYPSTDDVNHVWVTKSGASLSDNKWHHIVATADGTTLRMYVDGVISASKDRAILPVETTSTRDVYIGGDPAFTTTRDYVGLLDTVRVYDGAISSQTVAQHYNSGKGLYDVSAVSGSYLRAEWLCNDGPGAVSISDTSPYNNVGHFTSPSTDPTWVLGRKVFKRTTPEYITRVSDNVLQLHSFPSYIANEWLGAHALAISGSFPSDKVTAGYLIFANTRNIVTVAPIYEQYLRV